VNAETNAVLVDKINKAIKNAVGEGRDYLSDAESIYVLKIADVMVKEYQKVLYANQ